MKTDHQIAHLAYLNAHILQKTSHLFHKWTIGQWKQYAALDLVQLNWMIQTALNVCRKVIELNGTCIFLLRPNPEIEQLFRDFLQPYLTTKWIPGLLTNFKSTKKGILQAALIQTNASTISLSSKKKQSPYQNLIPLKRLPDLVILFHPDVSAIKEAAHLNIPIIALIDPRDYLPHSILPLIPYPIPINRNKKVIEYITSLFLKLFKEKANKESDSKDL